jgi:hypothetical protein
MTGYHVTTPRKLARYRDTGGILRPVRFWAFESSARAWAKRVGRSVILRIDVPDAEAHPLPDHKPTGHAYWTPRMVRDWTEIEA